VVELFTCSILVLNVHSLISCDPSRHKTADPQKLRRFATFTQGTWYVDLCLACRPEQEAGESSRVWSKLPSCLNCLTACGAGSPPHHQHNQCTSLPPLRFPPTSHNGSTNDFPHPPSRRQDYLAIPHPPLSHPIIRHLNTDLYSASVQCCACSAMLLRLFRQTSGHHAPHRRARSARSRAASRSRRARRPER